MIVKGKGYCFIDEKGIWDKIYMDSNLKIKHEFYEILDTFKMDSQIATENSKAAAANEKLEKRKRKSKTSKNGGAGFLSEKSKIVETVWKQFHQDGCIIRKEKSSVNNREAREAAEKVKHFNWIEKFSSKKIKANDLDTVELVDGESYAMVSDDSKLKMFKNINDKCIKINVDGEEFVIPELAKFIPGSVEAVKYLDYADEKFDLIILDPPWPNKSVKRLRSYNTFQIEDLFDLPIESLCHSKTAVIIWLTNNPTVHSSIDRILETWGLESFAICHWLKITKSGEPIFPLNSTHKVPFESFIVAFPTSQKMGNEEERKNFDIKDNFCFISTPNSCHSRKPPIGEILKQLIPEMKFEKSLELYGRYLSPRTTTIGFEVLKFQHIISNFDLTC